MKTNGRRERELNGVIELTRDEIIERITEQRSGSTVVGDIMTLWRA